MGARNIYALILAAGQSRRMGQSKQTLPYGDGTILDTIIGSVLESSVDGLAITCNRMVYEWLADVLPEDCTLALNENADSEMLESVQIGLAALDEAFQLNDEDGVLVMLGDQPQVTAGTITTCAEAYRLPQKPPGILIATYGGQRGHPTIFSRGILNEVLDWSADRRLNELAGLYPDEVRELPITSGPRPIDVNTPQDYDEVCRLRLHRPEEDE